MLLEEYCNILIGCIKNICSCLIPERDESTLRFVYNNSVDDVVDNEDSSSIPLCTYSKYNDNEKSNDNINFYSCTSATHK